jgi:hypothetical protein
MSKVILLNQAALMHTSAPPPDTGNISWGNASTIAVDVNVTNQQGTSPTLQILVDRLGADGVTYFNMYDSGAISVSTASTTPVVIKQSIGPGCTKTEEIGSSGRVRWVIGGGSTPGALFTLSIQGE